MYNNIIQNFDIIKQEFEEFILLNQEIRDEEVYNWLIKCSGEIDHQLYHTHINDIYQENPSITRRDISFHSCKEGYYKAKELNHWNFIPIYLDNKFLYSNLFTNTYKLLTTKTIMMGFMILKAGMIVPWHNHPNNPSKITHYNLYNLDFPAFFYFSNTMPYTDPSPIIVQEYLQKEKDCVSFNTLKYHKTDNKNTRDRITFVIEEEL